LGSAALAIFVILIAIAAVTISAASIAEPISTQDHQPTFSLLPRSKH